MDVKEEAGNEETCTEVTSFTEETDYYSYTLLYQQMILWLRQLQFLLKIRTACVKVYYNSPHPNHCSCFHGNFPSQLLGKMSSQHEVPLF